MSTPDEYDADAAAVLTAVEGEEERIASGGKVAGISAGAATLFLVLRLMAVAHWNWQTAFEIAGTINISDAVPIVFGTLFAEPVYTAILLMLLLPPVALGVIWPMQRHDHSRTLTRLILLAALVAGTLALTVTYGQWWLPTGALVLIAVLVAARAIWRHGAGKRTIAWILRRFGVIALGGTLVLAVTVTDPWMPREEVATSDGILDGYVLEVQSGYVHVLTTNDRRVEIVLSGDVTSRTVIPR